MQEHIKAAGGGGKVSAYTYDLASFAEVRKLAEAVKAEHKKLDVLINNAGIFAKQKTLSKDGIELTWAVNMLAPFLLTSLLLDTIQERIVNVGSMALASKMDFDNLQQVRYRAHMFAESCGVTCMQIKLIQAERGAQELLVLCQVIMHACRYTCTFLFAIHTEVDLSYVLTSPHAPTSHYDTPRLVFSVLTLSL